MRRFIMVSLAGLLLAACGRGGPSGPTATPAALATPNAAYPGGASPTPVPLVPAATASPAAAAPTATSLADGMTLRLSSYDPNPNCPDHYPWFFENPADECASYVLNTWTVWETFEHGLMVWTQEGGLTYVLIDDGAPFKPFQIVSDPIGLPLPEPDPSLAPPEGMYQPERGFALFWRGLVPGSEWVRPALGWATAPESAYSAFRQCNTATGDAARCYLNGPHDEIIVLAGSAPLWTYVQRAQR